MYCFNKISAALSHARSSHGNMKTKRTLHAVAKVQAKVFDFV